MKAWVTVLKAADTAAHWHAHQRRKGKHEEPYINHLLEVAMLVAEATEGKRPDLVIAALLHDAIEDQEVPRGMIAASFGEDVASLVEELTDDKTQPRPPASNTRWTARHASRRARRSSSSRTRPAT